MTLNPQVQAYALWTASGAYRPNGTPTTHKGTQHSAIILANDSVSDDALEIIAHALINSGSQINQHTFSEQYTSMSVNGMPASQFVKQRASKQCSVPSFTSDARAIYVIEKGLVNTQKIVCDSSVSLQRMFPNILPHSGIMTRLYLQPDNHFNPLTSKANIDYFCSASW